MLNSKLSNNKFFNILSLSFNLGFIIVTPMIILTLIGVWLDKLLGYQPIITIGGILLGVILGLLTAYQQLTKIKW